MAIAYLASEAGKIRGINSTLRFEDVNGNSTKLLPQKTDQIVVLGNVGITGGALKVLADNKIDICFVKGQNTARLVYEEPKNGFLRHRQHLLVEDEQWVADTSRAIVRGKVRNQIHFLQRIASKNNGISRITDAIAVLHEILMRLEYTDDVNDIRGLEGIAARFYFDCLGYDLNCDWTSFNGRAKNPPRDEVNSALSFLYVVLANRIAVLIENEGLDGFVGSLHSMSYGRNSLSYDLVEEYRTPIVDTLVFSLFNKGQLREEHFEYVIEEGDDEPAVYLNEKGRKVAIAQFEKKLDVEHEYLSEYDALPYREIIGNQVHLYRKYIEGKVDSYSPLEVR